VVFGVRPPGTEEGRSTQVFPLVEGMVVLSFYYF
jgi:hypothetical protein